MPKKLSLLFLAISFSPFLCFPQGAPQYDTRQVIPGGTTTVGDNPMEQFGGTITESDLFAHLSFLASDELEGRETAERGQKIAARYLAAQFAKLGLVPPVKTEGENSYFQVFELQKTQIKDAKISLGAGKKYSFLTDFQVYSKSALSNDLDLEIVFAGYGINDEKYDNLSALDLKGKAAVILKGEPMDPSGKSRITGTEDLSDYSGDRSLKLRMLEERGAAAVVVILPEKDFNSLRSNPWVKRRMKHATIGLVEKQEEHSIPEIFVSEELGNAILANGKMDYASAKVLLDNSDKVPQLKMKKMRFVLENDIVNEIITSENVLGFLEGTDKKEELLILTAHYDHLGIRDGKVYNGADDDGSGTVAILELAEAFVEATKAGHRPRRSILFMPVSGEEKGLLGSSYYADNPVFPLEYTVANLNIDMIGRWDKEHEGKPDYVYIIGSDVLSSELHAVNEEANNEYGMLDLDYTYNSPDDPNRFYYRSDHYNFAKNDIPVIFYFTGVHEDYHKATDEIEKISFSRLQKITKLIYATAWKIANRDERLIVDKKNIFPSDR